MKRHDYEQEAVLRGRVKADPTQADAHTQLAAWLTRAGRLGQAREALQAGLAIAGGTGRLYHLLGLVFAGAGEYDSAIRHLESAVAREPSRFEFLRDLALIEGAAGRTADSMESLRQAMSLGGEQAAAALGWLRKVGEKALASTGGRVERRPPQPQRRAVILERLVARDPEVAEALVAGKTSLTPRDHETLRATRKTLAALAAAHPTYADLHFGLSLVAEQLGEIDRAIEAAEKAIAINPRYAEACLLAVRLYVKSGRPEQAVDHCRKATELRPRWVDAHVRLGGLLNDQGRKDEAATAYRKALEIDARCSEAKQGLAVVGADAGRGGDA